MTIEIIEESLGWRTFIHWGYQIIWSKGQNNENINKNQCILNKKTISGINLHWNYQKHFWFIYIKELLVQKYWQLISTKQLWSVRNSVSSKSRTVQYRVPRCPGQYRNVQDRVPTDVQVSTEMSRIHQDVIATTLGDYRYRPTGAVSNMIDDRSIGLT